jgi:tetratricopeptide (TPR) repeat protein
MNKRILLALTTLLICIDFGYSSDQSVHRNIDSLKILLEKNPNSYELNFKLGCCYQSLMQYSAAETAFKKVLKFKKNHRLTIIKLADVYGYLGKYEDMFNLCKNYGNISDPINYKVLYRAGVALCLLGKYKEAADYFMKSMQKSPDFTVTANMSLVMSMIRLNENDTVTSNNWLKKYLNIYYNATERTSIVNYLLGNYQAAIAELKKHIPEEKFAMMDLYNLGIFMIAKGDKSGLEKMKIASEKSKTGYCHAVYDAVCYIQKDSIDEAQQKLLKSYKSESGICNALLAWIYEKMGKPDDANVYWFNCFGKVPLGINVELMRSFLNRFIETIKS